MATVLNAFNCIPSGGNTAVPQCAVDIKSIIGCVLLPAGTQFLAATLTSEAVFLAALQTATLALKPQRAFPVQNFEEIKDNTEQPKEDTLGYGDSSIVREGYYKWDFQFIKGGFCLSKSLRKFNSQNVDVMFVDANGLLFGLKVGTALQGINTSYTYSAPFMVNNGSKVTQYWLKFVFKPYFIDSIGFVQLNPGDFQNVVGLNDVVIGSGGARVANVSLVTAAFSCGGLSLYALYSIALASASLWAGTDSVTGLPVAITSVAASATFQGWTITFNASDPNYNVGNPMNITMAAPSVLNAADVFAVESNIFTTPN
jgi:hypothetical protein